MNLKIGDVLIGDLGLVKVERKHYCGHFALSRKQGDRKIHFIWPWSSIKAHFRKVTKLELFLFGLDNENDAVYNEEKEQI